MASEDRVFQVLDSNGKVTKLVQAKTPAKVRAHLLRDIEVQEASGLTVAKWKDGGDAIEVAAE